MNSKNNQSGGYGSRILRISNKKITQAILKKCYPPAPFVNCISRDHRKLIEKYIFKDGNRVLDVGSGLVKGPGAWLWNKRPNCQIIRMDICEGEDVDIVADATNPPRDIGKFDAIVMQSVPEHVLEIDKLFFEMKLLLKVDGYLYIEMPFMQGVHADPDDYWRATPEGLSQLVKPMRVIAFGVSGGPIGSLIWIFSDLLSGITKLGYLNFGVRFLLRWAASPLRYLDIPLRRTRAASRLACENYILAKKDLDD